jgi:hypothetical protein
MPINLVGFSARAYAEHTDMRAAIASSGSGRGAELQVGVFEPGSAELIAESNAETERPCGSMLPAEPDRLPVAPAVFVAACTLP